nr:hypothetical protein [Tanacetum cinerariifolium]
DEFYDEKDKLRKKHHDDQDPSPPPDSDPKAPSSSSKQQSGLYSKQPFEDVPMLDTTLMSDSEDTDSTHLLNIKPRPEWLKPIPEEDRPATPEPDWFSKRIRKKKLSKAYLEGPTFKVVKGFHENSISLQFQMEDFHRLLTDKVNLVNPEGHRLLPDLSKPLPLGGPLDFLFKEDYTIISKPRAVIYRDRNDQKKMLRENEVQKFSDGTLTRVLHKLDHMVKDFRVYQYNTGMEYRIWSEDDKRRSAEFIEVIERRLFSLTVLVKLASFT